jgi:hypothetical protein
MNSSRLAIVSLCVLLCACVATPQGTSSQNASAETFQPVPGQAVLYIYRFEYNRNTVVLQLNGKMLGEFLPGTYFRVVLPPGEQVVQGVNFDLGRIRVDVAAGGVGYVRDDPSGAMGSMQSRFTIMPAGKAQAEIRRCCTLLDTYAHGQRRLVF